MPALKNCLPPWPVTACVVMSWLPLSVPVMTGVAVCTLTYGLLAALTDDAAPLADR